jgi:SNF2 family DNA or RNA helicase
MHAIHAEIGVADAAGRREVFLVAGGAPEQLVHQAKLLETLTPLFRQTDPPGALWARLTWPTVVQLSATFGPAFVPGPQLGAWITDQVARRTGPLPLSLPEWLSAPLAAAGLTPRPYQIAGAWEIARTGRALIFDEPRTGKTMTTILGLALAAGEQQLKGLPILVVCPASVVDPWVEAFRAWAPYWTAVAWRGPKRKDLLHTADVYVTSYETARMDATEMGKNEPLLQLAASSLVVDESHYIKNHTTHRAKAVRRLARITGRAGGSFVALSGTPITHHPADLWPALACLDEDANPSRDRWVKRYCTVLQTDYRDEILGLAPHTEPEFRLSIVGQHRRVARADVMNQLPPKVYSVRTVDLPAKWRKAYDDFESQMLADLPDDGGELSVMDVLSMFSHLSGLSSAPADVEVTYGPDVDEKTGELKRHVHLDLKAPSWKVQALMEVLGERCGPDVPAGERDSVVVFAPSAQLIRLAGKEAERLGHRVGYIIGGQTPKARTETRQAFQAGELDVVLATTSAGGEGITLSRAGTLVFLQRPWSLKDNIQAEDRAEGEHPDLGVPSRGTEVIDIVARNTLDTHVRSVLRERAGQLADLVQDPRIVAQLLGGADTERKSA